MKKLLLILCSFFAISAHAQYTKLLDFDRTNGALPSGSLLSDGTFLYGMTELGGANDNGIFFKIKPDGTGFTKLMDFGGNISEWWPWGSLISDSTFLYGMTQGGGANNDGVIFRIKPDGTGYAKLFDFDGANGKYPYGTLISDGTFLYGIADEGGANDIGVVFKIRPDGTGYTKLLDFDGTTNGAYPNGSLISDGTFLYGMTYLGGANNNGVVFKIRSDGTGYAKLLDFDGTSGAYPYGSLISDGTFLYGMTTQGGANSNGTIFKIMPDGTGYTKLLDFDGTNGAFPTGSLLSDGTFLYGMTYLGASKVDTNGVVFKIRPDGTDYTKLFDFDGAKGSHPLGSLISDGTYLYGVAKLGGANNDGVIFKYPLAVTTGITRSETAQAEDLQVFPNPAGSSITIKVPENNSGLLSIYNTFGQCVKTQKITGTQTQIAISDLASDIYIMRLENTNGKQLTSRFAKTE